MSYRSAVLADTPWAYWPMDIDAVADVSGNSRSGTYLNEPLVSKSPSEEV